MFYLVKYGKEEDEVVEELKPVEPFVSTIATRREALEWWRTCTLAEKRLAMINAQYDKSTIHSLLRGNIEQIYLIHSEVNNIITE